MLPSTQIKAHNDKIRQSFPISILVYSMNDCIYSIIFILHRPSSMGECSSEETKTKHQDSREIPCTEGFHVPGVEAASSPSSLTEACAKLYSRDPNTSVNAQEAFVSN